MGGGGGGGAFERGFSFFFAWVWGECTSFPRLHNITARLPDKILNAAGVGEVGVGYHALLLRALASLDVGFFAEGLVLLLDCLLEIKVLLAALTCLVDDGLGFAVAAAAVDKEGVAALAGEYGRGLELFDRDFLLKACSSVRQTAAMGVSAGALLPGAGTQPGNALALIIGRPMPAEGVGGRRRRWGGTGGGGGGASRDLVCCPRRKREGG